MRASSSSTQAALLFVISFTFISLCDGSRTIEKICPVVLPDGPATSTTSNAEQARIINGELANNLHPYMGALKSFGELVCSATLLSEYWALTAAHCLFNPKFTTFMTGGDRFDNGVEIEIEKGIVHELYPIGSEINIINDIQLIKLKTPAPPTAKFVKLNSNASIPASLSFARAAGYGKTLGTAFPTSGVLRQVDVPVQPMSVCKKQYASIKLFRAYHICAGYVRGGCDSCSGDSGGPLFVFDDELNVFQVGIVSFGYDCAMPDSSGVYSKISSQIDWIRKQGAGFDTASSGVDFFADPETGAPLEYSAGEVTDNASTETTTENVTAIVATENSSSPAPPEETPASAADAISDEASLLSAATECFPGSALVTLEDGSTKEMHALQIGDSVQVGPGQYSKVFMFTHRISGGAHKFVKITNSLSEYAVLLTPGHVLPLNSEYKEAGLAKVGDVVELGDGRQAEITRVERVVDSGLFNPNTLTGRVVVNGVVASTYTNAVEMKAAHALLTPLRYLFEIGGGRDATWGALDRGFPSWVKSGPL